MSKEAHSRAGRGDGDGDDESDGESDESHVMTNKMPKLRWMRS